MKDLQTFIQENPQAKYLVLEYEGSGDSGAINSIAICDADDSDIEIPQEVGFGKRANIEFDEMIDALGLSGFEIDGGGHGTLCFDIQRSDHGIVMPLNEDKS